MNRYLILLLALAFLSLSQTIYNPQDLYDSPGGLFDEDSLRDIHLDFYDPNYHTIWLTHGIIILMKESLLY